MTLNHEKTSHFCFFSLWGKENYCDKNTERPATFLIFVYILLIFSRCSKFERNMSVVRLKKMHRLVKCGNKVKCRDDDKNKL